MILKVKLETVIESLDSYDDMEEYGWYININTGEEFILWDEYVNNDENEELYNSILENPNLYIRLPDTRSIDMLDMRNNFLSKIVLEKKQWKKLKRCNNHRKSTFDFLRKINELGLLSEWELYRDKQYEQYAKKWCKKNNIIWI